MHWRRARGAPATSRALPAALPDRLGDAMLRARVPSLVMLAGRDATAAEFSLAGGKDGALRRWLQAAVSRQREFLADARAVQWTRNRDGLGGVLRKALTQRAQAATSPADPPMPPAAHHLMLLGPWIAQGGHFDAHPPIAQRILRIYGRPMQALPLEAGVAEGATSA